MENLDNNLRIRNLHKLEVNKKLQEFKESEFVKMEFKSIEDNILLTFKSLAGHYNTLQLIKCYAFNDMGDNRDKVNEIIVKDVGHFFREHCNARHIDSRFCYQVEVYPINYKTLVDGEIRYNTFFAICEDIVVHTSLENEVEFLEVE
jgi:hypothetical protein